LRRATIKRNTTETQISLRLDLDGQGRYDVRTGIRFFDHMLELFTRHGGFNLTLAASGDLDVDAHHTVEDVGIALGEAVAAALGTKRGINRAGYFIMPMDETLAVAAIDLSGRPFAVVDLQLAVENKKVQATAESYVKALSNIADGSDDVIGYVFAINGKVNSADIYGSNALFKKLWPKLLKANATEAIAELQDGRFKPASAENVQGFLSESEKAKGSDKDLNSRVNLLTREDDENILFETRDKQQQGVWIHRNYIKKN